jgi:hypothetical protein
LARNNILCFKQEKVKLLNLKLQELRIQLSRRAPVQHSQSPGFDPWYYKKISIKKCHPPMNKNKTIGKCL